jgi:hypothetical protein
VELNDVNIVGAHRAPAVLNASSDIRSSVDVRRAHWLTRDAPAFSRQNEFAAPM